MNVMNNKDSINQVRVNNHTEIINKDGVHIATIHGELNIDIVAEFFIKTPIIKKDIGQTA